MYYLRKEIDTPLYQQLSQQIIEEIQQGLSGQLPSIRSLSDELKVSKGTVENAYELLVADDWLENRPQQGFFVRTKMNFDNVNEYDKDLVQPDYDFSMQYASSMLETHAKTAWNQSLNRAIQLQFDRKLQTTIGKQGSLALREEIVKMLARRRGIRIDAEQIVITTGSSESLTIVLQILQNQLQRQIKLGMENPGYRNAYETLQRQGVKISPIAVDPTNGIKLDQIKALPLDLIYVTPSHQFPLGVTMPIAKRQDLLDLIKDKDSLIIEDDYDSEFSVLSEPVPALRAMDAENIIYLGGFSKSISSELRLSFVVLPVKLLKVYQQLFAYGTNSVSFIIQQAVTDFLQSGAYNRHVRRASQLNRQKYELLEKKLQPLIAGNIITAHFGEAGIHLVFQLNNPKNIEPFEKALDQQRLYLRKMNRYWFTKEKRGYYIIGFAHFSYQEFEQGLNKLVRILQTLSAKK